MSRRFYLPEGGRGKGRGHNSKQLQEPGNITRDHPRNRNQPNPIASVNVHVVQQDNYHDQEPQASEKRKARASALFERTRQMALESGKHVHESSEDEDDVDIDDDQLLSTTLKSYSSLAGQNDSTKPTDGLARTKNLFNDVCKTGALSCLICISSVKRNDAVKQNNTN
jgi:hypothetical protein